MKFALYPTVDGSFEIVGPDLKPLGDADAEQPMLHVLPKLYMLRGARPEHMTLNVSCSLPVSIVPEGGIHIRQPCPNRRYYVGGSADSRNGWLVALPDGVSEFDIKFQWTLQRPSDGDVTFGAWRIEHLIHVKLRAGAGHTWSMDAANWPHDPDLPPPGKRSPVSIRDMDDDAASLLEARDIVRSEYIDEAFARGFALDERVEIPGVPLEKAWSINAFNELQIHEVEHTETIANGIGAHRANALIEMPARLFLDAVLLARDVPFSGSVSDTPGGLERHPALKLLCDWWDGVRPAGEPFRPGLCMPYVRVCDDGQYWCGYYEYPNNPVEGFNPGGRNTARLGDLILVQFQAAQESARFDERGMTIMRPDGTDDATVGVGEGEYRSGKFDEAWYSLDALAEFPRRFPAAWRWIEQECWNTSPNKLESDRLLEELGERTDIDPVKVSWDLGGLLLLNPAEETPDYDIDGVAIHGTTGVKLREVFDRYGAVAHHILPDNATTILWQEIAAEPDEDGCFLVNNSHPCPDQVGHNYRFPGEDIP